MKQLTQEWIDVDFRYPGKSATKANAKQAVKDCGEVRQVVRTAFGLPV